jgi:hypothetical protein
MLIENEKTVYMIIYAIYLLRYSISPPHHMILFHIVYDDFTTVCIGADAEKGNCHDIFSAADRYSCEDRYHRFHPGESRERYTAHPLSERKVSSMNVIRTDLYRCIDGPGCVDICPCDVFYFDEAAHKSVMPIRRTARAAASAI